MIDRRRGLERWWFLAAIAAAILVRVALLPFWTVDQRDYLIPWMHHAEASGAGYLLRSVTDYPPFYDHVLAFLALFPGSAIVRIKLFSIGFDFILAGLLAALVPTGKKRLAAALFLLMPTVILNSSAWAQCDAIYSSFVVLALMCVVQRRAVAAMLVFGVAVAVKLQAAIFGPFLLLMTLERRQPIWTYLLLPIPYVLIALPMLLAGRDPQQTFLVYAGQFGKNAQLAAVSPNPWIVLNKLMDYHTGVIVGLPVAVAIILAAVFWLWRGRVARSTDGLLLAAAFVVALVPFVTPKMHERFFYLVDPMLILLACRDWRYIRVLAIAEAASLISYIPFMLISTDPEGPIVRSYVWLQENYGGGYGVLAVPGAMLMGTALYLLFRRLREMRESAGPAGVTPAVAMR
jgi:Gpi18-like mannosyltransferase